MLKYLHNSIFGGTDFLNFIFNAPAKVCLYDFTDQLLEFKERFSAWIDILERLSDKIIMTINKKLHV